jgi:lipopolysaccharide cholinephosphotransferase
MITAKSLYAIAGNRAGLFQLTDIELSRLKELLLGMMDDFLEVCSRENLLVMMRSGTLLGAVRHKGFIPWDDDLDFMMPRNDYDRLLEIFEKELGSKYVVQTPISEPNACFGFMKIRKKNTAFVEVETAGLPIHKGAFIDIFPLEYAPESSIARFFHGLGCMLLKQISTACAFYRFPSQPMKILRTYSRRLHYMLLFREILGFLFSFCSVGWWNKQTELLCSKFKKRDSGIWVVPYGGKKYFGEAYKREVFLPTTLLEFEKRLIPAPGNWDHWLSNRYGNYMQIPDSNKIERHWVVEVKFD